MGRVWTFCIVALVLLSGVSCSRYEEGPNFSMRSKFQRACNVWVIDKVFKEGNDITTDFTSYYRNYQLNIFDTKTYTKSWTTNVAILYDEAGTWKLTDAKTKLYFGNTRGDYEYKILRLANLQLWVEYEENGSTYQLQLRGLIP
jgi:hypothetical protein